MNEQRNERSRLHHAKHKAECIAKGLCYYCGHKARKDKTLCLSCSIKHSKNTLILYNRNKELVYKHYGNKCKCCGETNPLFLSIDHINNDGSHHRKTFSISLSTWLVHNNFPKDFQLLCYNCNMGKARNGGVCPHKTSPRNKNK